MAKGRKSGGRDWVKGQSGNPKGGIGLPKDIRDAKKMTAADFSRLAIDLLYTTRDRINDKLKDPAATMIELVVAGIIAKAATEQDYMRANFLLDRILGKPKQNDEQPQMKPVTIVTRGGDRIELGMVDKKDDED